VELSEASEVHVIAARQRVGDGFEYRVNSVGSGLLASDSFVSSNFF